MLWYDAVWHFLNFFSDFLHTNYNYKIKHYFCDGINKLWVLLNKKKKRIKICITYFSIMFFPVKSEDGKKTLKNI